MEKDYEPVFPIAYSCILCKEDKAEEDILYDSPDGSICKTCFHTTPNTFSCEDCGEDFESIGVPLFCPICHSLKIGHSLIILNNYLKKYRTKIICLNCGLPEMSMLGTQVIGCLYCRAFFNVKVYSERISWNKI